MTFDSLYPNDPDTSIEEICEAMVERAALGGEESFGYVSGAVWAIARCKQHLTRDDAISLLREVFISQNIESIRTSDEREHDMLVEMGR